MSLKDYINLSDNERRALIRAAADAANKAQRKVVQKARAMAKQSGSGRA